MEAQVTGLKELVEALCDSRYCIGRATHVDVEF
jgi:hypothetical protein